MSLDMKRVGAASMLASAGALWPTAFCAVTDAMLTPYQRALSAAWCGAGDPAVEFLGHCPACWAGAAAFLIAAAMMLAPSRQPRRQAAI
jgi:hypothetical protein